MEVLNEQNWTEQVTTRLKKFEMNVIKALKEKGWDGKESEETVTWTFAGGLFYSITVITTIGKYKMCTKVHRVSKGNICNGKKLHYECLFII